MLIFRNCSIKQYNTFGIDVKASVLIEYEHDEEIIRFIVSHQDKCRQVKHLILGEGSNLLFRDDFYGLIIHPVGKKLDLVNEDENYIYIKASAGYIWDDFVEDTLNSKAFGLENLSLIPGTVGASAVQNIGAYGSEAKDFIFELEYLDLDSHEIKILKNSECKFAYRTSIFKNDLKNKALILNVTFKLLKFPNINCDYADIQKYFNNKTNITAKDIREAVINIRNIKLPDPKKFGNAGSFFKNPIINQEKFEILREKHEDLRFYSLADGNYKLAAGWMIDKLGLKTFTHKGAAVHENQALVLINKTGKATGKDICELAEIIKEKVYQNFEIELEPEVIYI
ncbi:MAG: UDP-N-acetylmuramate dehydrogenase [Bacteroidales bacterium]|jgi:UDP-N-acetylmuramate dehydrogenase|nr:UDP-N-acetylmuramate dehydrogenase [Bacteroidales bacterium]MCK9498863.1 UDP-N-acetylmuramate dehydrogenase [Bacteroidales bacterium]MDY0314814.1 UDP-N-acetylmuramate dehydrogenase [Bacteroidales bacterium]NLB85983.1 UDP-N-acetylmuramate dehydrogenase [Bacteroidales bacterium]